MHWAPSLRGARARIPLVLADLDNGLRGGIPILIGDSAHSTDDSTGFVRPKIFHVTTTAAELQPYYRRPPQSSLNPSLAITLVTDHPLTPPMMMMNVAGLLAHPR